MVKEYLESVYIVKLKPTVFTERINVWYDVVFSKITLFSVSTTRKIELSLIEMKGNI